MVLVSGSTDAVAIWDLDNVILRYKIPIHKDQVNHMQLLVSLFKENLHFLHNTKAGLQNIPFITF